MGSQITHLRKYSSQLVPITTTHPYHIFSTSIYTVPMIHTIYEWILNFTGVNNTYNSFSTHMYNFWSGFGGNISVLALVGTVIGVYRHNLKRLEKLHPLHLMKNQLDLVHRKDKPDA